MGGETFRIVESPWLHTESREPPQRRNGSTRCRKHTSVFFAAMDSSLRPRTKRL